MNWVGCWCGCFDLGFTVLICFVTALFFNFIWLALLFAGLCVVVCVVVFCFVRRGFGVVVLR